MPTYNARTYIKLIEYSHDNQLYQTQVNITEFSI